MKFLNERTREIDGLYEVPLHGKVETFNFLTIVLLLCIDLVFSRRNFSVILNWAEPNH